MATNITFKTNNPWRSSVGSLYEQDIFDWILQHPEQYQTINDFQRNHWDIYTRNTDSGQIRSAINADDKTRQYQQAINNTFGFVNTKGIAGGISSGRYNAVVNPNSGDRATIWKPEGLYGAYTDDRRVLGRIGDYTAENLKTFAKKLEPVGLEIYLDPSTNYYMIRPINGTKVPERDMSTIRKAENESNLDPGNNNENNTDKTWLNLYKKSKSNYPGWSDWLPLTAKKIVDDLAAVRTGILERKKVFPKVEAPYEYAKVTDAYAQRQLLEKQKQEVLARAGYSPTSDLQQNAQARAKGEELAQQISDKQVALKSQEFAETSKLVQDVANRNKIRQVEAANQNAQVNAAAMNNIINSRIKQNERLANALGTYIGDMYTNFGEYLKTKRLNENARKRAQAYNLFNKQRESYTKDFYNLQDHPENWTGLNQFIADIQNEIASGAINLTDAQQAIWNAGKNDPAFKNLIINLLKTGQSTAAQRHRALYEKDLQKLSEAATKNITIAEDSLRSVLESIDTYATNQWGWNPTSRVHASVLSQKQGGKIEDRFSRLERIRQKEQQSVRENTQKRNKMLSDNLNKQLDRISKEELALLRAIFK